jgi:hypothetical protein
MNRTLLTLRINRRAIGAVVLDNEELTLTDGRHLSSKSDKIVAAATRFVEYLLILIKPSLLVVDAPIGKGDSATTRVMVAVRDLASSKGLELFPVSKTEILAAYGIRGARNRRELRTLIRHYWPELSRMRGKVEPFVVDAAAAALYADCRVNLERIPA